ncbi:MAG TPA: DUF664 domain-containing protein [Acidimicrobiales bacterium]|nr:DUF664 domain-containing protein [Acidimicrobiales bacterium]
MTGAQLLTDAFGRILEGVHDVLEDVAPAALLQRVGDKGNSIAWLVWHLTRVQDDHLAGITGAEQVWTAAGWERRFGLPLEASDTGYGHGPREVAAVRAGAENLRGYFDAVHEATVGFVGSVSDAELDRVVDTRWDPPVTMGVRLVSVVADDLQHVGQAAFLKGLLAGG